MSLVPGSSLGPYEILGPLGAGGMGEVYRARDSRLGRDVAVKVLPEHLSDSPELRARFEREARAASSLNHPHICTIYDIGSEGNVDYLVMELLEGRTLDRRLAAGPLPKGELLGVGIQIADALDRAHRSGLVHRDLKPGNIMLTKAGAKLMDFGLAKTAEAAAASPLTAAPTATSPLTADGTLLGTVQYMSPEQLEGKEADARSDLFALGAVVYEMAAGRPAFHGPTQASVIASILKEQPRRLRELDGPAPPALDRLVAACLIKDPDERVQSAHDVRMQLEWIAKGDDSPPTVPIEATSRAGRHLPWVAAGLLLVAALAGWATALWPPGGGTRGREEIRFIVELRPEVQRGSSVDLNFVPSPDGRSLAFMTRGPDGQSQIYVRRLDSVDAVPVPGTAGGDSPFWSPDGRFLGFSLGGGLAKVPVSGGSPQTLAQLTGAFSAASWGPDGTILFSMQGSGVLAIPDSGGRLRSITEPDRDAGEIGHMFPSFLPDGRRFLFLKFKRDPDERAILVGSLDGGEPVLLLRSRFPAAYMDPGYLLHVRGSTLFAQEMALDPPALRGEPHVVAGDIVTAAVPGLAGFSTSRSGLILFRGLDDTPTRTRLSWFGRAGARMKSMGPGADISVSLSPDGNRAALERVSGVGADSAGSNPPTNLWVLDLARNVGTRLTTVAADSDENPVWSPDGRMLAYASHKRGGDAVLIVRPATGSGEGRQVDVPGRNPHPHDWSSDGDRILLHVTSPDGDLDLLAVPASGDGETIPVASSAFDDSQGQFSPDGRWVAYTSSLSGGSEVYVRSFPEGDQQWQVSSAGGFTPRWRGDGRELYYVAPDDRLMVVSVESSADLRIGAPEPLFEVPMFGEDFFFYGGAGNYAPAPDGKRFLVNEVLSSSGLGPLQVVVNWRPPAPGR